ncbi:hypothetical protein BC332_20885 [Capsicum chinense]|nr:hypothetical protein BC332_20885 [Capsicum chinense]
MDQVMNMLDTEIPIPTMLERPISLIVDLDDIERSVSISGGSVEHDNESEDVYEEEYGEEFVNESEDNVDFEDEP